MIKRMHFIHHSFHGFTLQLMISCFAASHRHNKTNTYKWECVHPPVYASMHWHTYMDIYIYIQKIYMHVERCMPMHLCMWVPVLVFMYKCRRSMAEVPTTFTSKAIRISVVSVVCMSHWEYVVQALFAVGVNESPIKHMVAKHTHMNNTLYNIWIMPTIMMI